MTGAVALRPTSADALVVAGLTRLSTCDWPGRLVATVFLQGCPWRCTYCHNADLQPPRGAGAATWTQVRHLLSRRQGMLDGVVFSGGEPTMQRGLGEAAAEVRELGFGVGLHTAGAYPGRLRDVLAWVDWVGLDVKALPAGYRAVTGVSSAAQKAYESLRVVVASGVAYEVRVTVDPSVHSDSGVRELVDDLQQSGVSRIVLQEMRCLGSVPAPAMPVLTHPPEGVAVRRAS